MLNILEANYVDNYIIHLTYENGIEGDVDFSKQKKINIFEPWKDKENFKNFHINTELQTLEWENGADIAPEYLYSKVTGIAQEDAFLEMMEEQKKLKRISTQPIMG